MEHLLLKMARQLDALDEASLLSLWEKYALLVSRFEPTKRWEEAALVFSIIQAKHWKNQLFNHHWAAQVRPSENSEDARGKGMAPPTFALDWPSNQEGDISEEAPRATVLQFRPRGTPPKGSEPEPPLSEPPLGPHVED